MKKPLIWLFIVVVTILTSAVCLAVEPSSPLPADVKTMLKAQIRQTWDYRNSRVDREFLCDVRADSDLAEYLEVTGGADLHVDLGDVYVAFVLDDFEVFLCLPNDKCACRLSCKPYSLYYNIPSIECHEQIEAALANHSQQEFNDALRKALR